MKIILKETRTLPVPNNLVDAITKIYRGAYIKLVIDFIQNNIGKSTNTRTSQKYKDLLQQVKDIYDSDISDAEALGTNIRKLTVRKVIKNGEMIKSIPIEQFITALLTQPELETYIRGRIKPKQLKTRLNRYFKNKNIKDIQFNIEFGMRGTTSKKDYAGLYQSHIDAIIITFNSSFFIPVHTGQQDNTGKEITVSPGLSVASRSVEGILNNIETELEDTGTSVRHEVQHLFQNMMSNVLGIDDWSVGIPPRDVLNSISSDEEELPHHLQPIEIQTDIQDESDKFLSYVSKFKEKNLDKPDIYPQAIKILLKLFADSKLTAEENKFADNYDLDIYVTPSELLRTMKSSLGQRELYNYAVQVLYCSVSDQLQESIIMNKIKIVLKENQILNEELTKEEIRNIIRDEFEKLLKKTETKKDIAKITKEFVKKFYRELSFSSTHVIDQIDV